MQYIVKPVSCLGKQGDKLGFVIIRADQSYDKLPVSWDKSLTQRDCRGSGLKVSGSSGENKCFFALNNTVEYISEFAILSLLGRRL